MAPANALVEIPGGTFEAEGHIYRDVMGRRVLSVTQIFELLGLNDYAGVPPEVLRRKAEVGVAVHKATELNLTWKLDWDTVEEEILGYVVGADIWFRRVRFELAEAEHQGIHIAHGMQYGYQYDQRGWMVYQGRRRPVIVDLKTALEVSPTWAIQTAGYELAAPPLPAGETYLRVVLHLEENGNVTPLYYDNPEDRNTFLYMAYVATWKQKHYGLAA